MEIEKDNKDQDLVRFAKAVSEMLEMYKNLSNRLLEQQIVTARLQLKVKALASGMYVLLATFVVLTIIRIFL